MELFRRHSATCKHRDRGRAYTKCQCPIWADNRPKIPLQSLRTRNWDQAIRRLDKLASGDGSARTPTISGALEMFLDDCAARHLAESTIDRYRRMLLPLVAWFGDRCRLPDATTERLTAYRRSRKVSPLTQSKELECLKSFCWFAVNHGWITHNPAKRIKPPVVDATPTLPYDDAEVKSLLDSCGRMQNWYEDSAARARVRARALVLLLLYSGLRISDAVKLEQSRLTGDGRLMLRQMKTGNPVYVRLPLVCIEALTTLPDAKFFFWSGESQLSTAIGSARRTIACLGRMTGINAHPHRFRDTFAVNLLLKGVDIRTVSLLLGHKSIRTTERHYAPFVSGFQKMLDDAVSKLTF